MGCAYAALTGPQITQSPYTSHSFVPCSHSEALVSRKAVKEFPVEAHRSLRLELHACVLCINAAFQQCHVKIILIVCGGESGGGGGNQSGERNIPLLRISAAPPPR